MPHRDTSLAIKQAIYGCQMMETIQRSKCHTGTQAKPEREFKGYNLCKCSQIIRSRSRVGSFLKTNVKWTIVFVSFFNRFQKQLFLKTNHSFWTFRKWITIVFIKTICDRFLYDCFLKTMLLKKRSFLNKFLLTIILTIVNEGSSLTKDRR